MLYREIIAVCSQIHTKLINTLCGQNVEFVNVKSGGTYSNHWVLNGASVHLTTHNHVSAHVLMTVTDLRTLHQMLHV
jgi:hypothetical protein